jgi:hypothetical protein
VRDHSIRQSSRASGARSNTPFVYRLTKHNHLVISLRLLLLLLLLDDVVVAIGGGGASCIRGGGGGSGGGGGGFVIVVLVFLIMLFAVCSVLLASRSFTWCSHLCCLTTNMRRDLKKADILLDADVELLLREHAQRFEKGRHFTRR